MHKAPLIVVVFLLSLVSGDAIVANTLQAAEAIRPSARIIGGFQTNIDRVPSAVALLNRRRVELDGDLFQAQFCGGTVIAPRWILTAAHCVVDLRGNQTLAENLLVLSGSTDLDNPVNQPIPVVQVIAHPDYRSVEQGRDIALLQLEYDALVQPIILDTLPVELDGTALIVGWGAVNSQEDGRSQSFPKQLRGAFVNTTPGLTCGALYPDYNGYTDNTTICAGISDGGRDSCQGDSGGPLYRISGPDSTVRAISGITSWGIGCGAATNPGVYTNVTAYIGWINDNLRANATEQLAEQPVNDSAPQQAPPPSVINTASSSDTQSDTQSNNNEQQPDHVFSGSLWFGLLPLTGLILWRRVQTVHDSPV